RRFSGWVCSRRIIKLHEKFQADSCPAWNLLLWEKSIRYFHCPSWLPSYSSPPRSWGAKDTPRSTSPDFAERMVLKCPSPSPVGKLVALRTSVTLTNLFGSAPWSPLLLIVEVTAKMV